MARVLISMKDEFLERIDEVAEYEHRSRSELIREGPANLHFSSEYGGSAGCSCITDGHTAPTPSRGARCALVLSLETWHLSGMLPELQANLTPGQAFQLTIWDPSDDSVEHFLLVNVIQNVGMAFLVQAESPEAFQAVRPFLLKDVVVGALLESNPRPCCFYPRVQAIDAVSTDSVWLRLDPELPIEHIERNYVRVSMLVPVQVQGYNKQDYNMDIASHSQDASLASISAVPVLTCEGKTINVSAGGLKMIMPEAVTPEIFLHVTFQLNPNEPPLTLQGTVVECQPNPQARRLEDRYLVRCRFLHLTSAQENQIVKECFRRQASEKRRLGGV